MLRRRNNTLATATAGAKYAPKEELYLRPSETKALMAASAGSHSDGNDDDVFAPGWEVYGEMSHPGVSDRMIRAVSHVLPRDESVELFLIGVDVDFEDIEEMLLQAPSAPLASSKTRLMLSNFKQGLCTDLQCVAFVNGKVAAFEEQSLLHMFHTAAETVQACFRKHLAHGGLQRKVRVLQKFLKRGVRVQERITPNRMRTRARWMWTDQYCSCLKVGRQNRREDTCETTLEFRNITAVNQVANNGESVAYTVAGTTGSSKKVVSVTFVIEEGGLGLEETLLSLVLKKRGEPLTAEQLLKRVSGGSVNDWFQCT